MCPLVAVPFVRKTFSDDVAPVGRVTAPGTPLSSPV
jgi:hypothetical protein